MTHGQPMDVLTQNSIRNSNSQFKNGMQISQRRSNLIEDNYSH